MKTSFHLALFLYCFQFFFQPLIAQNDFIPLQIDSSYTYKFSIGLHGDTSITETYSAYSYDSNDSLIQQRNPNSIFHYSYAPDTTWLLIETPDSNQIWQTSARNTLAYQNGKIVSRLFENYVDDNWQKSARYQYFYDERGLDTLFLTQHWREAAWKNFRKTEWAYDDNGNNIEEKKYFAYENNEFDFMNGELFAYDEFNRKIERITLSSSNGEIRYLWKLNWLYGNDHLLDTIIRCDYIGNDTTNCQPEFLSIYNYPSEGISIKRGYTWEDFWLYYVKSTTFKGQELYGNEPDSIITHSYYGDSTNIITSIRHYFKYEELGNNQIYFKEEKYNRTNASPEWILSRVVEKWYHIKGTNTSISPQNIFDEENLVFYPNPCPPGAILNLKNALPEGAEILVFDPLGRVISKISDLSLTTFKAPDKQGIYTFVLLKDRHPIGVSKLIISN